MNTFTYNRPVSPLMLADRLLTLAQDADRAGYLDAASQLVVLAFSVLDEPASGHSTAVPSWGHLVGQPTGQPAQFRGTDWSTDDACQPHA